MAEADLLRRLASNNRSDEGPTAAVNDPGELELSLGLSLGGCFGTDPRHKGLVRSSSIASLSFPRREQEGSVEPGLNRACSLPVETEEEQRKRKEFQSLRRMEAKRKRSEKRGFSLVSQGSAGSQGSNSSDISDFDSRSMQGLDISGGGSCRETWSPSSIQPLPDHTNQKGADSPVGSNAGKPTNSAEDSSKKKNRIRRNGMRDMMEEMPCVFTRGDGPNGRRIEGFLYRCRKGEQVRIVCVCHGSFFSPAEFVKHAGGGDVAHPLRHIVVNPSPSTFL